MEKHNSNLVIKNNKLISGKNAVGHVIVPDGVTEIANSAFSRNTQLESILIPESVKLIDEYAFFCCESLQKVTIVNPKCKIIDVDEFFLIRKYRLPTTICSSYINGNPNDAIYSTWFGLVEKDRSYFSGVICGDVGSTAEEYAKNYCKFEAIEKA